MTVYGAGSQRTLSALQVADTEMIRLSYPFTYKPLEGLIKRKMLEIPFLEPGRTTPGA